MRIAIPEFALVLLIGPSGSGKSTFARKHFRQSEILSSDYCRYLVSDDENDQSATDDAFRVLHLVAAKRLARGKLTVIDATNVQTRARKPLLALARRFYAPTVAIAFNVPEGACLARNAARAGRTVAQSVISKQRTDMATALSRLAREGFEKVYIIDEIAEIDSAEIVRESCLSSHYRHRTQYGRLWTTSSVSLPGFRKSWSVFSKISRRILRCIVEVFGWRRQV